MHHMKEFIKENRDQINQNRDQIKEIMTKMNENKHDILSAIQAMNTKEEKEDESKS